MTNVLAYLGAIVAANLLVTTFGPAVVIVNAFLFIGLDLTCRDKLHDAWEGRDLWTRMLALIAAGGFISYLVNVDAGPIALASCVAFALASLADAATYWWLSRKVTTTTKDEYVGYSRTITTRRFSKFERVNGSNVVGAAVDSLVFPTLAFGALLPVIVLGQFVAKVAGGFVWFFILNTITRAAANTAARRTGTAAR